MKPPPEQEYLAQITRFHDWCEEHGIHFKIGMIEAMQNRMNIDRPALPAAPAPAAGPSIREKIAAKRSGKAVPA